MNGRGSTENNIQLNERVLNPNVKPDQGFQPELLSLESRQLLRYHINQLQRFYYNLKHSSSLKEGQCMLLFLKPCVHVVASYSSHIQKAFVRIHGSSLEYSSAQVSLVRRAFIELSVIQKSISEKTKLKSSVMEIG